MTKLRSLPSSFCTAINYKYGSFSVSHTDGYFNLHIWNQFIILAAMQQQSVFCHTCVVDVLSSFNASASLSACGGHVCARPKIAYLNFTSQSLHLPSPLLASTMKLRPLTFFRMEAILLICMDNPSSFTLSLLLHCRVMCKHYSLIIVLKSLAE